MIGKAIAGEAKATFFYISASSLTSKWVCVIFLDFHMVMVQRNSLIFVWEYVMT